MSSLFVAAKVDISDAEKGLAAAERSAHNLAPAFRELKRPMREDQKDHGKRQRGPIGAWARRSSKTLAFYRTHGRGRIPRPLGRLSTAVTYKATAHGLSGESRAKWSEIHMSGGTAGRGARIRPRPFLWLSTKFLGVVEYVIERKILAAFGGGK